jgi:hypothetical protein
MTCVNGGFLNSPRSYSYAWLRNGTTISGPTAASYTLTDADLGRTIACRMSATNSAGTADATSEALYVSAPAPAPAAVAAPEPKTTTAAPVATKKAASLKFKASCKLAASHKSIVCTVSTSAKTKFSGTVRLAGKTASVSRKGTGKVKLTLRSSKKLKKGQKVVLKITSGKTTKVITAKAS